MQRLKYVAALLVCSLTFVSAAPQISLAAALDQASSEKAPVSDQIYPSEKKSPQRLYELTDLRDQYSKYYRNSDGSITAETSLESRHYKDADGKWKDISNRLVSSTEAGFAKRNTANSFETNFANQSQAKFLASLKLDKNSSLAWSLENANKVNGIETEESVTFPDILQATDLQFLPHSDGLKENIILKSSSSPNVFNFTLTLKGLSPVAQDDGTITLKDSKSGEEKFTLPNPFMYDSNGEYSEAVTMKLEPTKNPNVYSIVVTADQNWLNDKKRTFPVTIDPTVKTKNAAGSVNSDTYVAENSTIKYYQNLYMTSGKDVNLGKTRGYVKFNLPSVPAGAIVTDAVLSLYKYTTTTNPADVRVARVIDSWDQTAIVWNSQPAVDEDNLHTQIADTTVNGNYIGYVNFNVWSIVKSWVNGGLANNGFMIRHFDETKPLFFYRTSDYGSSVPYLSLTYITDPIGVNPYWSYANTPLGSVNTFNGNFITSVADFSLPGRGIPINITRTYNSRGTLNGLFGEKWFSNLDMQLQIFSWGAVLLDSTGAERPFMLKSDGQTYEAPTNYPMQLYKMPNNTYIVQEANTSGAFQEMLPFVTFDSSGKLKELNDGKKNVTKVEFLTGSVKVTDPSLRTMTLTLNADGTVKQVTSSAESGKVKASYSYNDKYLTSVTYDNSPDINATVSVNYGWSNGLLTFVSDKEGKLSHINYNDSNQVTSVGVQNLLANPSLESGSTTDVDHWSKTVLNDSGSVSQLQEGKFGRKGLKIASVTKAGVTGTSYLYANQKVPVQKNFQYTLSSLIRTNALAGRAFIMIEQLTKDGTHISWHDTRSTALTGTVSNWTPRELTVTAADDAAYFVVYLEVDHGTTQFGGEAYFDGVQLEQSATASDFQGRTDFRYGTQTVGSKTYDSAWVTSPTGELTQFLQNNYGNPEAIIKDPRDGNPKAETWLSWDAQDRLRSLTTPNQKVTGKSYTWQYDEFGNPEKAKDPVPNRPETEMTYYYNRLENLTQADGNKVQNIWDPVNLNMNTSIDQTLNSKAYSYDAVGNVTAETNLLGVADNRLLNSGFTRFGGNNQPSDWSPTTPSNALVNKVEFDGTAPDGGSNVLHINPGTDPYAYQWFTDFIDLTTGGTPDNFAISGYLRTAQTGTEGGARLNVYWFDQNKNNIEPVDVLFDVRSIDWQQYVKNLKSPQGAVYAKVAAIVYGPYDGYFDNIQFEKSELPRGYNSLENSSFEKDSLRWVASSGYSTVVNDPAGSYSGSKSAIISLPSASISYLETEYPIPANPSLYYTLTGFIKTMNVAPTTGGAWLHIYFYDSAGTRINDYATKKVSGSTGWTKYALSFKPPANTVTMKVRVELANASGTAQFDNIRLSTGKLGVSSSYDGNSNYVTSVTDQLGNTTSITPDAYGQTQQIKSPTGEQTNFAYNGQGQLRSVTDNAQNSTNYKLDKNGNIEEVSTANQYNVAKFEYDVNGNLAWEKDGLNNTTTFAYDEGGRLKLKTNPNATTVSTGYDFYGNLNRLQLSGGQSYDFSYDLDGQRKSSVVYNASGQKTQEFSYTYDEVGNLLGTVEKNGSGTVIGEFTKPTGNTMYSHIDLIQGFDLKYGGSTTTYNFTYTKGGLIKTVSAAGKTYAFEYDENNNLISRSYGNSTQDVYTYNEANQVATAQTINSSNESKASSKYSYDKDGRLISVQGSGAGSPSAMYVYNAATVGEKLNRLTKATINDRDFNYSYDPAGNLLSMTTPSGSLTFSYDNPNGTKNDNRIYALNNDPSAVSYDNNGNLTKLTLNGTTYQYGYDAMNRLISVKNGAGSTTSYTYDGDGNRLTKTVDQGDTTTYHYFKGELQYETVTKRSGEVYMSARYTRTPGGQLLSVNLYNPGNGTYGDYYYHYNAHGDVVAVTDQNQDVFRQYVYDPYGNIISVKDKNGNLVDINNDSGFNHAYTYAGYRYDKESGLYFLNARYYHAGIGRFLTKDTFKGETQDTSTLNRYAYAGGDPVSFVDPSGNRYIESASDGRETLAPQTPEAAKKRTTVNILKKTSNFATTAGIIASTVVVGIAFIPAAGALATIGSLAGLISLLSGGIGLVAEIGLYYNRESTIGDVVYAALGNLPPLRVVGSGAIAAGRLGVKAAGFRAKFLPKIGETYRALGSGHSSVIDTGISLGLGIKDLD